VDDVVFERVHEHGRDETAVLADFVKLTIGGACEADVLEDARHLFGRALPTEQKLVDLGFPRPKAGAGAGARRARLVAVTAVTRSAELVFGLERLVDALVVV